MVTRLLRIPVVGGLRPLVEPTRSRQQAMIDAAAEAVRVRMRTYYARRPELMMVGVLTLTPSGMVQSAAVQWPDGTAGVYTATESTAQPGEWDLYSVTYGTSETWYQARVTRNAQGRVTARTALSATRPSDPNNPGTPGTGTDAGYGLEPYGTTGYGSP